MREIDRLSRVREERVKSDMAKKHRMTIGGVDSQAAAARPSAQGARWRPSVVNALVSLPDVSVL
jgi:hypothetical protein